MEVRQPGKKRLLGWLYYLDVDSFASTSNSSFGQFGTGPDHSLSFATIMSAFHTFNIPFDRAFQHGPRRGIRIRKKRPASEIDSDDELEQDESGDAKMLSEPEGQPQEPDDNPRGFPFPHAPAAATSAPGTKPPTFAELDNDFAALKPPLLFDVAQEIGPGSGHRTTLKRRHVAVLTAILHRGLLQRDWVRAGRAFGMLLRTEMGGAGVELRRHGLWGIGAEILLRAPGQEEALRRRATRSASACGEDEDADVADADEADADEAPAFFTAKGMERARRYYERLVLQYPYRSWAPGWLSSLHFYRAMFGLWIAYVGDQQKRVQLPRRSEKPALSPDAMRDTSPSDVEDQDSGTTRKFGLTLYGQAGEIAKRMDEVLLSYPYCDDADLWELRGHVAHWMADMAPSSPNSPAPEVGQDDNMETVGASGESIPMHRERAQEALERAARLRKARQAHGGGGVPSES